MDPQTRTLILRAQQRDPEALEALFERYREPLRRALRRLLGERYRRSLADSEDAAHDAILAALQRLQRFEYRGEGSFMAWLLRCAESEILHRLRAAAASKRDIDREQPIGALAAGRLPDAGTSPSQAARGHELEERLRECLQQLPPREAEIIVLRRYLGCEFEEICEELELPSPGAARALLSRAQARLASMMLVR